MKLPPNSPNSPDHDALEDRQLGLVPGPPLGVRPPITRDEGGGGSSLGSGKELEEQWRLSYYIIGWRCIGRDSKTGKSYAFFINSRRIKIRTILYTVQYHIHRLL